MNYLLFCCLMLRLVTWSHDLAPTFSLTPTPTPLRLCPAAHCFPLDLPLESLPHFITKICLGILPALQKSILM